VDQIAPQILKWVLTHWCIRTRA